MKSLKKMIGGMAMIALSLCFAACSSDDEPSYSTAAVTNSELKTILTGKGYQFNEQGNLLLDDKANQTTQLDLSGTNISADALSELTILPNLTEVSLKNNGYGPAFDFAKLPAQITGVDLTGNEIYDYDNLVKVDVAENGDETVTNLHEITKLYLPNEAKDNIAQLMRFYRQNKTAIDNGTMDVKMVNASETLEKYTTLREVSDETLRAYLKTLFSDIFEGDYIDISKHLGNDQKTNIITIGKYLNVESVSSLEGIQYIVNNPYWEGTTLTLKPTEMVDLPKIKIPETVTTLTLGNLHLKENLDFSYATKLYYLYINNISGLTSVDLSLNSIWGQRGYDNESDGVTGTQLFALDCPDLEEIIFPNADNLGAYTIDVECLPNLKNFSMSSFHMIANLSIGDLPESFELVYPDLTDFKGGIKKNKTYFSISESTYNRQSTKDFINKYYTNSTTKYLGKTANLQCSKNTGYRWY